MEHKPNTEAPLTGLTVKSCSNNECDYGSGDAFGPLCRLVGNLNSAFIGPFLAAAGLALVLSCTGCASAPKTVSAWPSQYSYKSTAHVEKVWIKESFDFNGYDALYIAETQSDVQLTDVREQDLLVHARQSLVSELQRGLRTNGVFRVVVTNLQEIKADAKALVLEPSIVGFRKGSRATRFWVGFGAGMPAMIVRGRFSERGDSAPLCLFEMNAAGEEAAGYVFGEFINDKDLQTADIRGLTYDLSNFIVGIAHHQVVQYKKNPAE